MNELKTVLSVEAVLAKAKNIFFVGIGGISMSSLAMVCKRQGFTVSGSDRAYSALTDRLEREGIPVIHEHRAENIEGADAIVYTGAVDFTNPELAAATERNIPVIYRADLLGHMMRGYTHRVGVSGMHGKSTCTSMIAHLFIAAGKDPVGEITLTARDTGSEVIIEIKDDGRGVNCDAVLKKAIKNGIANPDMEYSRREILNFLMMPGFSTNVEVTEFSGRGVGMDVVKRSVEELGGTVTNGIISATARTLLIDGNTMTLLQTNAAVNPGNSGGGLFNMAGQLIGVVNAKCSDDDVEGLGFAIPVDTVYEIMTDMIGMTVSYVDDLKQYGYVRGIVDSGLSLYDVTSIQEAFYYFNARSTGVYVLESAYSSEIEYGDRIVSVNGTAVSTVSEVSALLGQMQVGDTLTLVLRRSGRDFEVSFELQEYVPEEFRNNVSFE